MYNFLETFILIHLVNKFTSSVTQPSPEPMFHVAWTHHLENTSRSTPARIWGATVVWEKSRQTTYSVQLESITHTKSSLQLMQEFEEIYAIHPHIHLSFPQVI